MVYEWFELQFHLIAGARRRCGARASPAFARLHREPSQSASEVALSVPRFGAAFSRSFSQLEHGLQVLQTRPSRRRVPFVAAILED
jgi:hypothetical protein